MGIARWFGGFATVGAAGCLAASASAPVVDYPAGYRQWAHVTSGMNGAVYGPYEGLYHIYANAKAVHGYRTGRFPDGAMIVFDLHEARPADQVTQPGTRKFIDVMQKNARKFPSTDGWGYEKFASGDARQRRLPAEAMNRCHSCHEAKQSADFVISRFEN